MKIIDYEIVRHTYALNLTIEVDKFIKDGWVPQGGVTFCSRDSEYAQAMVKYES